MKLVSEVKELVSNVVADSTFESDNTGLIDNAIKWATRRVNKGEREGVKAQRRVGYEWQKLKASFSFTAGTEAYTFTTLTVDNDTFKFPWDVRVETDENVRFEQLEATSWRYKRGVLDSSQHAYAIDFVDNVRNLLIYYGTTDTLEFEYYDNRMLIDDGGTIYKAEFSADDDKYLMDDDFIDCIVEAAAAWIYRIREDESSQNYVRTLRFADEALTNLISSKGVLEKKPIRRLATRSMWNSYQNRIKNN